MTSARAPCGAIANILDRRPASDRADDRRCGDAARRCADLAIHLGRHEVPDFTPLADPGRFNECFMDESWVEHLRQHERGRVVDRETQQRAKAFVVEGESTRSSHWLADRQP